MTDKELEKKAKRYSSRYARQYYHNDKSGFTTSEEEVYKAYIAGFEAGRPKWHKLDWEKDYPELDRLVRVRTKYREEYICETFAYYPAEDEIGYGHILTQFEQLDGDWVDDNDIEYWCYIEPFNE
jgi:hypothetical protein